MDGELLCCQGPFGCLNIVSEPYGIDRWALGSQEAADLSVLSCTRAKPQDFMDLRCENQRRTSLLVLVEISEYICSRPLV